MHQDYSTLELLRRLIAGGPTMGVTSPMNYPPGIWETLGLRLIEIDVAFARFTLDIDLRAHGNQLGTVHGGVLCELADAAIGTAHSTAIGPDDSFATVELKMNFFRPVRESHLTATARRVNAGRTLSYYLCDITNEQGKLVATVSSTVMTLCDERAGGR